MQTTLETTATPKPAEQSLVCEECGRSDAVRVGDRVLCADCFSLHGSCCPELGKDDLWAEETKP